MKRFALGLPALLLLSFSAGAASPARAQQSGTQKIGFVNFLGILQQTPGYAQAESTLVNEREASRTEFGKLQAALDSAASDFEQRSVVLSPTARAAKRKELDSQRDQLEQKANELQNRLAARERELAGPIQSRVLAVIEGIRAEGNYGMIFDVSPASSAIVSADKSLDLTDKVLQRLKASK